MSVRFCFWGMVSFGATLCAHADPSNTGRGKPVVNLITENDQYAFRAGDRNYANGLRIERFGAPGDLWDVTQQVARTVPLLGLDQPELRQGLALSHAIYTPRNTLLTESDIDDRPYAGWFYLSGMLAATSEDRRDFSALHLNFGVVGPASQGEWLHDEWHALIREPQPRGWDYQIQNEVGLEFIAERGRKLAQFTTFGFESDFSVNANLALGNINTHAGAGFTMRLGTNLLDAAAPPRLRPAQMSGGVHNGSEDMNGYIFLGVEGRAVAHSIFLDGSLFDDDSPSVSDRAPLVADFQAGIALERWGAQLAFTLVQRTEEFRYQDGPHRFGSISLSLSY